VLGQKDPYTWQVFNYETGNEEALHEDKIRPANDALAKQLDESPEFSTVREVKFLKDHDPTLKSYIPSDPGDTVWFKQEAWTIIEAFGQEYLVENKSGERARVGRDELKAGKKLHSANWNRSEIGRGSFTSLSPDTVFSGQWVWVPAGKMFAATLKDTDTRRRLSHLRGEQLDIDEDHSVLAIVEYVEGEEVHLVRAYDGKHIVDQISDVHGVKSDVANTLNHSPSSKIYKKRVLEGKDTTIVPLGATKAALALGIGAPDLTDFAETKMVEHMRKKEEEVQLEIGISAVEPPGRNAVNRTKIDAQDVLDDITNYDRTEGGYKVALESSPATSESWGGGGLA